MHHSNMIRAIETADLIKQELKQPDLPIFMDPLLAEGLPVLPEPALVQQDIYVNDQKRIDLAFRKHFHRASPDQLEDSYELLVCHANVIRYFLCK